MIDALNEVEDSDELDIERIRRIECKTNDFPELVGKGLEFFVSSETKTFFRRFNLSTAFLYTDPLDWPENEEFKNELETVKKLKVVNDTAERAVKLIEDYNPCLTKNEEQKQFILQVVSDYRRCFPNAKKETLTQPL
ncbi:hypothetical protein ALC62_01338 [Cyphomyrmex costatus]|uniref:Uncharacterized protein n=1 Tax=Cyphomyrmex costatus TaxID=456900 RepID=A0A151IPD2_9HYME|nr:hypothetical protein ALC62_01338 [Cyphomyrmex costatus]